MSNQVTSLSFDTSSDIRITFINNEPYFCLVDICNILQLSNPTHIANQIKDEFSIPTLNVGMVKRPDGSSISATFISKKQLYFVMMRSRSPIAKKFRAWVYDVVEKLEKDGTYTLQQTTSPNNLNRLNSKEMIALKLSIRSIAMLYSHEYAARAAIWAAIRLRTGVPSPENFEYRHIPTIVDELNRIINISEMYARKRANLEKNIFNKAFKLGNDKKILDLIESSFEEVRSKMMVEFNKNFDDHRCEKLMSIYKNAHSIS